MNAATFRRLALEAPGSVESSHMGHPDFRIGGRIFASLPIEEDFGVVGLPLEAQEELVERHPGLFEPLKGSWGRQGWTRVHLRPARVAAVREALAHAVAKVSATARATKRSEPPARNRRNR